MPLQKLRIADILPPDIQVRTFGSEQAMFELKESMAEHGLIEPIVVYPEGDKYRLVSGDRRLRCARVLGWSEIEGVVRDYTPEKAAILRIHENAHREDPNPMDLAVYLRSCMDKFGWTQTQTAVHCGKTAGWISQRLKLLELDDDTKTMVALGELTAKHGYLAARLDDPQVRRVWVNHWAQYGVNVTTAEQQVQRYEDEQARREQVGEAMAEEVELPTYVRPPDKCYFCGNEQKDSPLLMILMCDMCRIALLQGIEWERQQGQGGER